MLGVALGAMSASASVADQGVACTIVVAPQAGGAGGAITGLGPAGGIYCQPGTGSAASAGAGGGGGGGAAGGAATGTGGDGGFGGASGFDPANPGAFNGGANYSGLSGGSGASVDYSANDTRSGGGGGGGGFGAVLIGSGAFAATAKIAGGAGGTGGQALSGSSGQGAGGGGGAGGIGVFVGSGASLAISTAASVGGGYGGRGGYGLLGGNGGNGGDGVYVANGSTLVSGGAVFGGNGASAGISFNGLIQSGGTGGRGIARAITGNIDVTSGSVKGGYGGAGAAGGVGVEFIQGGSLTSSGGAAITGGVGGSSSFSQTNGAGTGGAGITFSSSGTAGNAGSSLTGGAGGSAYGNSGAGGAGGSGIVMLGGGTVANAGAGAVTGQITGGAGGIGYSSNDAAPGSGGIGGTAVRGAGLTVSNTGAGAFISGGNGGGGVKLYSTFTGGAGGTGISASTSTIINSGSVTGGKGGDSSNISFFASGGTAITGSDLSIVNSGIISGGKAGGAFGENGPLAPPASVPLPAKAVQFTGGVNSLELQAGSAITGDVAAFSAQDTLILGGSASAKFDAAQIAAAGATNQQYQNFGIYEKRGPSTWTLTGTTPATTSWTVFGGTLAISSDGNLGAPAGTLTLNGGNLQNTAGIATTRTFILGTSGGGINTDPAAILTLSGQLQGTGQLTKLGTGTLRLAGTATNTGTTLIDAGTFQAGAANAFSAASAHRLASGATIDLAGFDQTIGSLAGTGTVTLGAGRLTLGGNNSSTVFSGAVSGTGGLTKAGTGTFTISGSITYSGVTNVNSGTFRAGGANAFSAGSTHAVAAGATVELAGFDQAIGGLAGSGTVMLGANRLTTGGNNSSTTYSGALSGTGGVTKTGTGTFVLAGSNTYQGATNITAGILQGGAANAFSAASAHTVAAGASIDLAGFEQAIGSLAGAGNIALGAGRLTTGGNNGSTVFAGNITGAGGLTKTGAGVFELLGSNSYAGSTRVEGGTLKGSLINNLSPQSAHIIAAGASLQLGAQDQAIGSLAGAGKVLLGAARLAVGADNSSTAFTGIISGSGGITKAGAGTFQVAGANAYLGATTVNSGILQAGAANSFSPASAHNVLAGATLDLAGFDQAVASLSGAGQVFLGNGRLTLGADNASTDFSGKISGTGGVTKTGAGTLALSGANRYSGVTYVSSGALAAQANNSFSPASALVIASAGKASLGGFNQTIASLAGAGSVDLGAARLNTGGDNSSTTYAGTISGSGGLTKTGTGSFTLSGINTYSGKTNVSNGSLVVTNAAAAGAGPVNLASGTTLAFQGSGYSFNNSINFADANFLDPALDSGAGTITLGGLISGADILSKTGSGTLIFTAANTYSGNTLLNAGTLQVDGSIAASPLTYIGSGASLTGSGTVGGIVALAGSSISPGSAGNPYGALRANGPVTFSPGSSFIANIAPASNSQLAVNGPAALNGNLAVSFAPGSYDPNAKYAVLTATRGVSGGFTSTVFTQVPGLTPIVTYGAGSVIVGFEQILNQTQATNGVQTLAGDRMGQMVTNRTLAMILGGFNEQINCNSCISGFGAIGSFSAGIHGRKSITNDFSIIGGAAYANYSSGGAEVTSAPILAGALRYDVTEWGASRPFGEIGVFASPSQRVTYKRSYNNAASSWTGGGKANASNYSAFAKLGWVWRLTPADEVAANGEFARLWQRVGAYSETFGVNNPAPASINSGTDRLNVVKFGGQWTHLFGSTIETQVNLGVVRSFGGTSGLIANVAGNGAIAGALRDQTWAEYGLRVGYRIQKGMIIDAFADGTLGEKPVGNTVHVGAAVRYTF